MAFLAVAGDVLLGGDGRMLARLDGVLFGRKADVYKRQGILPGRRRRSVCAKITVLLRNAKFSSDFRSAPAQ